MNEIYIFSFFAGSGFLDLGFELNNYKIAFVNEIHSPFLNAYKYSRNAMKLPQPEFGYSNIDINRLHTDNFFLKSSIQELKNRGKIIGFIAGPPCPDFSVGGKNRGSKGDKGRLSLDYIKIVQQYNPDFMLFENVKGLWRTKIHRIFYDGLKKELNDAGYFTTDKLLNSIEYGVPQDRERIILLGFKKELLRNLKLVGTNDQPNDSSLDFFPWNTFAKYSIGEINKINWPTTNVFVEDSLFPIPSGLIRELTVEYWFEKNNVTNHPNSNDHFAPRQGISKMKIIDEGDVSKKSYKRLHRWRYSPTVAYGNNEVHLHPYKIRRLSAAEAMSIQSLPREFELPYTMSLSDMFKTIGNGVPFLMAHSVAKSILSFIQGEI